MYVPDNYDAFERYADQQERTLDKLPKCCYCGEAIQDECLIDIDGELYHEDCFNDNFRKATSDYEQ